MQLFLLALLALDQAAALLAPRANSVATFQARRTEPLRAADPGPETSRRGGSIDQDGKSNIWAVEPKMKVDSEAKGGKGAAVAVGALLSVGLIVGSFLLINVEQ
ncbi:hypothetical protein M885DRAFT_303777 [Pelagophyceae sp. CCMP2097]|nr:hypothetical protein M885DRAFT_303777 [Pelagophyceae sp. CCMP2097]